MTRRKRPNTAVLAHTLLTRKAAFSSLLTGCLLSSAALLLSGCGATASFSPTPSASTAAASRTLRVMGGQQPVTGARIQLFTVGTAGDGSSAINILQSTVTSSDGSGIGNSNANVGNSGNALPAGAFTISNLYSCPSQSALVYITATGGNAGSGTNSGIAEMAAIGPCGLLSTTTNLNINELTTVAALAALQPYATSLTAIGSASTDAQNLQNAFALANELASTNTGTTPGLNAAPGTTIPSTTLSALANAVASCVNSSGGTAGDNTPCGNLYHLTTASTAPTDTFTALLHVFQNPTQNAAALFNLGSASAPFQPSLSSAPSTWAIAPVQNTTPSPLIAPSAGSYTGTQTVTLLNAVSGSTIYYTTDGTPATGNSTAYTGPFPLSANTTINAVAVAPGAGISPTSTAQLTIAPAPTTYPTLFNQSTIFMGASTIQYWPMPLHNKGVAGWTTSQILTIYPGDVLDHGYTRVVIDCGLNDVLDNVSNMPASAVNDIAEMASIASNAGIHVIIATVQEPNPSGTKASFTAGVDQLNVALKQMAQQNGYTIADFASGIDGHPEYYTDDIHPNATGYAIMEAILAASVNF